MKTWPMPHGWKLIYSAHGFSADRSTNKGEQPFAAFDPSGAALKKSDGKIRTFGKFGTAGQAMFEAWKERGIE